MTKYIAVIILLMATGCGKAKLRTNRVIEPASCNVELTETGSLITCSDGLTLEIPNQYIQVPVITVINLTTNITVCKKRKKKQTCETVTYVTSQ